MGGVDVFLTLALVVGEWSASCCGRFTHKGRGASTHWIGGWVGPRAGLKDVEERKFLTIPGLELNPSVLHPIASCYTGCASLALVGYYRN
jgi:hypothetical protein